MCGDHGREGAGKRVLIAWCLLQQEPDEAWSAFVPCFRGKTSTFPGCTGKDLGDHGPGRVASGPFASREAEASALSPGSSEPLASDALDRGGPGSSENPRLPGCIASART